MNNSQLLKGTLEGCVLLVIGQQEFYGYELVTKLQHLGFLISVQERSILFYKN